MANGRVDQTSEPGVLTDLHKRVRRLEDGDGSWPWVVVGTYPTDPGTTPDSPPFENGWLSVGAPFPAVAFKRWLNFVVLRGAFTGGPDNSTVFTLPTVYRPTSTEVLSPGSLSDGSGIFTCVVNTDGTVVYGTSGAL